jgi:nucleoside-diphosphate-sugar epimerase
VSFWSGKRVLVTGSRGFIGTALCSELRRAGAEVFGADIISGVGQTRPHNVTSWNVLSECFDHASPHVVFHLAAQTEVIRSHREPYRTLHTNVLGTLNVLELCRTYPVQALVVASSDKAYGDVPPSALPVRENYPLSWLGDVYSSSKRCADLLCHDYARLYGLPLRVLRCANTYGPGQTNPTTLVAGTIQRLLLGERAVVHAGRGKVKREWLYIDDAISAYLLAAEDAATGKVEDPDEPGAFAFNVGSGEVLSAREVVGRILNTFGQPTDVYALATTGAAPQLGHQCLDSTRFRSRFSEWKSVPFEEGLARTAQWWKERDHAQGSPGQGSLGPALARGNP